MSRALLLPTWSRRRIWLAVWLAGAAVTATLYLLPNSGPPGAHHADKIVHLAVFAALGMPLRAAALKARGFAAFVAVNVVLAIALEIAQSVVPGREFALLDVAANLAGLALGAAAGVGLEGFVGRWRRVRATGWTGAVAARATRAK